MARMLQAQEAKLLNLLLCNQGKLLYLDEIIEHMWGWSHRPSNPSHCICHIVWEMRRCGWPIVCVKQVGYLIPWQRSVATEEVKLAA